MIIQIWCIRHGVMVTPDPLVTGHKLVRVNLSDQTDMMDLLGADLPASGESAGRFAWSDGPLLQAIREGHWVLLDELNLAGKSLLFVSEQSFASLPGWDA